MARYRQLGETVGLMQKELATWVQPGMTERNLLAHFVTAFLLAKFYDDADAAAALAPEAVQIPGITVETTGF